MLNKIKDIETKPFRGGADIRHQNEPTLIPTGGYSAVQNFRNMNPGFKKRPGCAAQHSTADSTNKVMSLFQYSKADQTERHTYAQMSDGDVLEATTAPPGTTTGAFGSEVHDGTSSGMKPASWAVSSDIMFYANKSDRHKCFGGTTAKIGKFIVYKATATHNPYPVGGEEYTKEVRDSSTTTVAVLDSLGSLDLDFDCIYIRTDTNACAFNFTVSAANANAANFSMNYWDGNSWEGVSGFSDATDSPANSTVFSDGMTATTNWTASNATLSSVAGGQLTNCLQVAEAGGANPGDAYRDITTVAGQTYLMSYYFKKGTADTGRVGVGTSGDEFALYDSGNLSDASWTRKDCNFTASGTTTRVTLRTNDATAGETSLFDSLTFNTGAPLAQSGAMSWTLPTAAKPRFMFDEYGYWWQLYLAYGDLDSEVEVSSVTYKSGWQTVEGFSTTDLVESVEVQKYTNATSTYLTYSGDSVTMTGFATLNDKCYFCSADPVEAVYIEVLTACTDGANEHVESLYYWNGTAWTDASITTANFYGTAQSAWFYLGRFTQHETQISGTNGTKGYWYYFTIDGDLTAATVIAIYTIPYYEFSDFGVAQHIDSWNERAIYVFDQYPSYAYLSAKGAPFTLIGDDYQIHEMGDGRNNKIVNSKTVNGKWLCWQEEKGSDGGCISYLDTRTTDAGAEVISSPVAISNHVGTFNSKSVCVVDGVEAGFSSDQLYKQVAFFLSRYGVYVTDGVSALSVSDDIQNYFDQTDSNCIRTGYEAEHWICYDSTFKILRIGLVTGASASVPNTFLVYDIKNKAWMTDSLAQEFSCMTEVEAGSGTSPVVQIAGGTDDGTVYITNKPSTYSDVSTAINSYVTVENDAGGYKMHMGDLLLRAKSQSAGSITVTPYINGQAQTALTLAQTAATANDQHRKHRQHMDLTGDHISLKIQHNTADEDCYLLDYGVATEIKTAQ